MVQTVHLLLSDLDLILFAVASAGQPTEPSVVSRPRLLVVFVSANTPTNKACKNDDCAQCAGS